MVVFVREAGDDEVACVDLEERARVCADGALVVGGVGAVGGAHLSQDGAAAVQHIRDAKPAADLDGLAAGDDDLFAVRDCGQREQDC